MIAIANREIRVGDCRELLREIPDESVNCVVTSPPYFGLRDYGCDGQIGLEETPEAFVAEMVGEFREVRRALTSDGTLWLNIGDSFAAGKRGRDDEDEANLRRRFEDFGTARPKAGRKGANGESRAPSPGYKAKDLIGIPWMVAFALRSDGWYLRSDIIWAKPNPMPESVTDRPTKAHEYVFLLTKSPRYFYDSKAISWKSSNRLPGNAKPDKYTSAALAGDKRLRTKAGMFALHQKLQENGPPDTVNARTVWTIASHPYPVAHFATFPPELAQRCILAGCPAGGLVLDPFGGSGTVAEVAEALGRRWMLLELNPAYAEMAGKRTAQRGLFGDTAMDAAARTTSLHPTLQGERER